MSATAEIVSGSIWRRKADGRRCRVRGRYPEPFDLIVYRYLTPPEHGRGHGELGPRTNTTEAKSASFLRRFEPEVSNDD